MKLLDGIKRLWSGKQQQPEVKSWWTPYYGAAFGGTYDAFGGQKEPSKADMVKAYDDIVYACVSLIAQNIAHIPIKLYVKTATGQRQPKCATTKASSKIRQKYMGTDIKEVVEHPLLELLGKCNVYHNRVDLMELTEIYLDLTGNSYWLMSKNTLGIPEELYLLPSHLVQAERDDNNFVKDWVLNQGMQQRRYSLEDIIHFKYNNPLDPYGEGLSPLRGAWGRREISAKELSYLDNYLSNQGKPDAVLAVKDSISPLEAERIAKEFRHRYQGQGNGGLLVVDGTMNLQPLNFPAKDLAELQVYQVLKTVICNCFHIPPDTFELGTSSNRSTKEAAIYSFANDCLTPRLQGIVQRLNDRLVPYFDDRLFFDFDQIVPEDKAHELAVDQMLLSQQVITRNELRLKHGYTSEDWAKEPLLPSGVVPATAYFGDLDGTGEAGGDQGDGADGVAGPGVPNETPKDRTQQATAILNLQTAVYGGQLDRAAGLGTLQIVYGFSPEEAAILLPESARQGPNVQQPGQPAPELGKAVAGPKCREGEECDCEEGKCGGEGGKPGPCPEPGAEQSGHADRQHKIASAFHSMIDKQPHLSDQQKTDYKNATSMVIKNMSPKALDRLSQNVKKVRYYGDTAQLTDSLMKEDAKLRERFQGQNMRIKGAYDKKTGTLDLDGPDTLNGKPATTEHFYAHEMSHALDGAYSISGSKEWEAAWTAEIQGGKLSKMGTMSKHEGFAEFGRAMLVGKPELVKQHFPKSYAVWKAHME